MCVVVCRTSSYLSLRFVILYPLISDCIFSSFVALQLRDPAMQSLQEKIHELPVGFLGWAGNICNPALKMYASSISASYIETEYEKYVRDIELENLKLNEKQLV